MDWLSFIKAMSIDEHAARAKYQLAVDQAEDEDAQAAEDHAAGLDGLGGGGCGFHGTLSLFVPFYPLPGSVSSRHTMYGYAGGAIRFSLP